METIKICNLSKNYKDIQALNQVNLELQKGKIYGLLGRNGAGKSTLLKIIAERIKPTSGEILYDGKPALDDIASRQLYFSEPDNILPVLMTVKDFCYYTSLFYPRFNLEETNRILKDFEINEKKQLGLLSTGHFAIVRSIVALQTRADFILLDEPTLGHDAVNREFFYSEILRIYQQMQNTIILSTHLIDEISNLLEEVIFIDQGRIELEDSMENMMASHFLLTGPTDLVKDMQDSYTVIDKKEELGFTSLLIQHRNGELDLPQGIKRSKVGLQDIFIAHSKKKHK